MDYRLAAVWELVPAEYKICPECKTKLTLTNLDIHHKDGKRHNNKPENLIMMCGKCHRGALEREQPMITTSYRVHADLLKDIDEQARREGISPSALVRKILESNVRQN